MNRIFEGTNEINRLLAPTLLLKRAAAEDSPLLAAAARTLDGRTAPAPPPAGSQTDLAATTRRHVAILKQTALLVLGLAARTYGAALPQEQEVLLMAADLLRDAFAAESGMLRAEAHPGPDRIHTDLAAVIAFDACLRADAGARTAIAAMTSGDAGRALADARLTAFPVNTVAARRRIADRILQGNG